MGDDNGGLGTWNQWARHVVTTIDEIKQNQKETHDKISKIESDLIGFKTAYDTRMKDASRRSVAILTIGGLMIALASVLINVFVK